MNHPFEENHDYQNRSQSRSRVSIFIPATTIFSPKILKKRKQTRSETQQFRHLHHTKATLCDTQEPIPPPPPSLSLSLLCFSLFMRLSFPIEWLWFSKSLASEASFSTSHGLRQWWELGRAPQNALGTLGSERRRPPRRRAAQLFRVRVHRVPVREGFSCVRIGDSETRLRPG